MEKPILYRVSGRKDILMRYRGEFAKEGYSLTENTYTVRYEKPVYKAYTAEDRFIRKFRKKKCKVEKIPLRYTRNTTYRKAYFKAHPSPDGKYRCVYCGGRFPKKDITIDHLIPVNAAERSWVARDRIKRLGYSSVNDMDNLVPACRYCNSRKGTHMGLWLLRGRLGRKPWFWKVVKVGRFAMMVFAMFMIFYAFDLYM